MYQLVDIWVASNLGATMSNEIHTLMYMSLCEYTFSLLLAKYRATSRVGTMGLGPRKG